MPATLKDLTEQLKAILVAAEIPDDRKSDLAYAQAALVVITSYAKAALDKLEPIP